ncbi:MAG: hypothetical protein CTY19_16275 [Methylomonas sp.]|nr:MAG: hypothetical protein CTY19_16275 [Methylomonas sp.]
MHQKIHISYLDTIRGLAALTVINEHYVIAYGLPCETELCQQILDFSPLHIWWDGTAAVSMFFVLSGMVLSIKYFRVSHKPDMSQFHLSHFLIGRMFRIWLPYLLVLIISAGLFMQTFGSDVLNTRLPPTDWIVNMWHKYPLTLTDMLREGLLLDMPALIVLLPQSWTLSIELVLSLLLPIGLLLADRGTVWLVFFSLLAISLLNVSLFLLHFLMGLMIARYYSPISHYLSDKHWQRRLMLLAGLLFYSSGNYLPKTHFNDSAIWLLTGLGAGMILMFLLGSKQSQTGLAHPFLRQIGKVSYSAYLTHMAILICLTPFILKILEVWTSDSLSLWFGGWLITIVLVQGISLLFYHWLEIPSMLIGRRIADSLADSTAQVVKQWTK